MAKRIRISPDAGTTWYTFPGDQGDLTDTANAIKDTVFGQDFASDQTGMINWQISTNGLYKGFAGYVAKLLKSGTPTTFTAEATSSLGGNVYQITSVIKRIWDRTTPIVVWDGSTPVVPTSIDYLFGTVTLAAPPAGTLTIHSGKYLPMTQIAKANSFTLTQTAAVIMNSVFETAQANGGYDTYEYGLRTVSLSLKGIYASSNGFRALLAARSELVIEINPDGSSLTVARGFFKPMTTGQSGNVGALEDQTLNFSLSVPDQVDITLPFDWLFASGSTLSLALKTAINNWLDGVLATISYLPDGTTGSKGSAVITDVTLTGGLDVMNVFTVKFQGSDAPVAFP